MLTGLVVWCCVLVLPDLDIEQQRMKIVQIQMVRPLFAEPGNMKRSHILVAVLIRLRLHESAASF